MNCIFYDAYSVRAMNKLHIKYLTFFNLTTYRWPLLILKHFSFKWISTTRKLWITLRVFPYRMHIRLDRRQWSSASTSNLLKILGFRKILILIKIENLKITLHFPFSNFSEQVNWLRRINSTPIDFCVFLIKTVTRCFRILHLFKIAFLFHWVLLSRFKSIIWSSDWKRRISRQKINWPPFNDFIEFSHQITKWVYDFIV